MPLINVTPSIVSNEEADDRLYGLDGLRCKDPARKAGGQCSLEICITCSNINRPLVWTDNVDVRRKIRASRRLSHRFELLLLLVRLVLSFFLSLSPRTLYPFRSGVFFFLSSISVAFLAWILLSYSLNVSRIVASSKGCRAQKYLRTWDGAARKSIREPESY